MLGSEHIPLILRSKSCVHAGILLQVKTSCAVCYCKADLKTRAVHPLRPAVAAPRFTADVLSHHFTPHLKYN